MYKSDIDIASLIEILHREKCSCVILSCGQLTLCRERGVKDLYSILMSTPALLRGAMRADKVVGKGAAALMVSGKVREVYADVISSPALQLLRDADISVSYDVCVDNIINRAGTGICPVETLCAHATTAEECLPLITGFINNDKQ